MQNSYDNQEKLARQNSCCASGNLEYAGFWVRMAAYMIDSVVVFAGLLIVQMCIRDRQGTQQKKSAQRILKKYTIRQDMLWTRIQV